RGQAGRGDGGSRRDFLRGGALAGLGLTLPGMLRAEEHAVGSHSRARSVMLVYLGGGPSHHDSFDLKPRAPQEIRGKSRPIATNVAGTSRAMTMPPAAAIRCWR